MLKKVKPLPVLFLSGLLFSCLGLTFLTPPLRYSASYNATYDFSWPSLGPPIKTTFSTLFSNAKFLLSFQRSKRFWTSSFTLSKEGIFFSLSSWGPLHQACLESINSGDFGAFFSCEVFLTFFPAFVAVFFPSLNPDAFLGFCSSSLGSSISPGDPGSVLGLSNLNGFVAFLGC